MKTRKGMLLAAVLLAVAGPAWCQDENGASNIVREPASVLDQNDNTVAQSRSGADGGTIMQSPNLPTYREEADSADSVICKLTTLPPNASARRNSKLKLEELTSRPDGQSMSSFPDKVLEFEVPMPNERNAASGKVKAKWKHGQEPRSNTDKLKDVELWVKLKKADVSPDICDKLAFKIKKAEFLNDVVRRKKLAQLKLQLMKKRDAAGSFAPVEGAEFSLYGNGQSQVRNSGDVARN